MSSTNGMVPAIISEDSSSLSDQSQDGSSMSGSLEPSLETDGDILSRQQNVPPLVIINESDSTSSSDLLQQGRERPESSASSSEAKDSIQKDNTLLFTDNGTSVIPSPAKKKAKREESDDKKYKRKPVPKRSERKQKDVGDKGNSNEKDKETSTDETIYPKDTSSSNPRSVDDSNPCTLQPSCGKVLGRYLHVDSLQVSDGGTGMYLLGSLVRGTGSVDYGDMSIQEMVHGLTRPDWHTHHAALRASLLLDRLPTALKTLNMADAAECLIACDPDVQDRAVSCLEHILLENRHGNKSKESLIRVMNTTTSILFSDCGNTSHLLRFVYLFVLAACQLLQTCRRLSDIQRSMTLVKENFTSSVEGLAGRKKQSKELESAQHICEALIEAGISMDSLQKEQWLCVVEGDAFATCKVTDKELKQFSLASLFVRLYSRVLEMIKLGWSPMIAKLVQEVNSVHREVCRRKMKEHIQLIFEIFSLRCLTWVLSTKLNKDVEEVQGRTSDSPSKLVALVRQIVFYSRSKDKLMSEVRGLLFHPCVKVREAMVDLMTQCDQELSDAFLKYIDTRLRLAGIRVCCGFDLSSDDKIKQSRKKDCEWLDMKCLGNHGEKLKVTVHVPKKSCLGRNAFYKCKEQHQRSRQHEQNLDMLLNLNPHPNIISLQAFQFSSWPYFYITEDASELRLLHLLLDKRKLHQWLPSNILCQAALDVVSALDFLDGHRTILRDITTFNMTYHVLEGTNQNGGDITSIKVKIADLGLAKQLSCSENSYENPDVGRIFDAGPVPTRWTSVEALCYGQFSTKSMIYALGYVLYELFTHGCQPFSEMQGRSAEDILTLVVMVPGCTPPFKWACFPPDIFDLIRSCTARGTEERPSLPQIKRKLHEFLQGPMFSEAKVEVPSPTRMWKRGQEYPLLDTEQIKRNHVPERGIPRFIKDLVNGQTKYKNLMPDYWASQKSNKVNEELYSSDPITIRTQEGGSTSVQEVLMPGFVEHFLPVLQTSGLESVVCWTSPRLHIQSDHAVQERQYESAVKLADGARLHQLPPPGDGEKDINVHTCLAVAQCVCQLHQENWLYRDLKASNILITQETGKVILARIGRMVHLGEGEFIREQEMVFTDSLRWLSPEALHLNMYTKENDIFMLGTIFWEIYNIRQVCSRNPVATEKDLVPFPDKTKKEVMQLIQEGVQLPKVPDMPEWLYELINDCRHPDKEKRPTISVVITRLTPQCPPMSDDEKIMFYNYGVTEAPPSSFGKRLGSFWRQTLRRKTVKRSVSKTPDNTHHSYLNYSRNEYENIDGYYSGESESVQTSARTGKDSDFDHIDEDVANERHLHFPAFLKRKLTEHTKPLRSLCKAFLTKRKRRLKTKDEIIEEIDKEEVKPHEYDEPESIAYFSSEYDPNNSVPKTLSMKDQHKPLVSTVREVVFRQKMPVPPLPSSVIKHRNNDELSVPPTSQSFYKNIFSNGNYTNCLMQYSQPYEVRQNHKVSSWGDEVSPLHIKHKGQRKPEPDEPEYEECEVSNGNISPVSPGAASDDSPGAADDAKQQEEVTRRQVTCPGRNFYLTPIPEVLPHNEVSMTPSHSPPAHNIPSTTNLEQTETDTESENYIDCASKSL